MAEGPIRWVVRSVASVKSQVSRQHTAGRRQGLCARWCYYGAGIAPCPRYRSSCDVEGTLGCWTPPTLCSGTRLVSLWLIRNKDRPSNSRLCTRDCLPDLYRARTTRYSTLDTIRWFQHTAVHTVRKLRCLPMPLTSLSLLVKVETASRQANGRVTAP